MLGIRCDEQALLGIDFLNAGEISQNPDSAFAENVCRQLLNYFENPDAPFSIPLKLTGKPGTLATLSLSSTLSRKRERGQMNRCANFTTPATPHQKKVWQAMLAIPAGQTRTYGEIAVELHSCAQAVGQACGANPIPIVIPCHRVVSKSGLGGFMKHGSGAPLDIKRWLLAHERTA